MSESTSSRSITPDFSPAMSRFLDALSSRSWFFNVSISLSCSLNCSMMRRLTRSVTACKSAGVFSTFLSLDHTSCSILSALTRLELHCRLFLYSWHPQYRCFSPLFNFAPGAAIIPEPQEGHLINPDSGYLPEIRRGFPLLCESSLRCNASHFSSSMMGGCNPLDTIGDWLFPFLLNSDQLRYCPNRIVPL
jgi:hypothetical protein